MLFKVGHDELLPIYIFDLRKSRRSLKLVAFARERFPEKYASENFLFLFQAVFGFLKTFERKFHATREKHQERRVLSFPQHLLRVVFLKINEKTCPGYK